VQRGPGVLIQSERQLLARLADGPSRVYAINAKRKRALVG
jgi:hypothetical protein